jgi:hypothetical protein
LEPSEGKYSNNKYFVQQADRIIVSRGQWLNLSRNSGLRSGLLGCTIRLIPVNLRDCIKDNHCRKRTGSNVNYFINILINNYIKTEV